MFWIPETNKPPLIEEDAEKVLIERIQKEGIVPVSTDGFELIRLVHQG
jgi:hypothetical protein